MTAESRVRRLSAHLTTLPARATDITGMDLPQARLSKPRVAPIAKKDWPEALQKLIPGPAGNVFQTLANYPQFMEKWMRWATHVVFKVSGGSKNAKPCLIICGNFLTLERPDEGAEADAPSEFGDCAHRLAGKGPLHVLVVHQHRRYPVEGHSG